MNGSVPVAGSIRGSSQSIWDYAGIIRDIYRACDFRALVDYADDEGLFALPATVFAGEAELLLRRGFEVSYETIRVRTNQYLNNRTEQSHRPIKQRYYPMLGFKSFESASRFCTAFDELTNYLRVKSDSNDPGSAVVGRAQFIARWNTLINELAA